MSIWLGYPDESANDGSEGDTVQDLIDAVQSLDDEITQLEDQLVVELENSDTDQKRIEKEEFVDQADLGEDSISVSDDTTWSEIIDAYNERWRTEASAKRDALEDKLKWIRTVMDDKWTYGDIRIPHGKLAVDMETRITNSFTGEVRTKIGELADKILALNNKMLELAEALESERGGGSGETGSGNINQSILETVRGMKEVRISTVANVVTDDTRWLVEHQIPGRAGRNSEISSSVLQDMGRKPETLSFKGLITAKDDDRQSMHRKIETLKWFYKQRKPLYFSSTFVNKFESTKVVIEKLNFEENTESPYAVSFNCILKEYSEVNWRKPKREESNYLARQSQHWADYQALTAMVEYRLRYIDPDETVTTELIGNRLAKFLIGMNGRLKHLAAVGRLIESPGELGAGEVEVTVTNLSWNQEVARRGDTLDLTADVTGIPDGTSANIQIWEYDDDGSHDLITTIPATVKDNKLSQPWDYEYHEDVDEAPTAEESEKGYNPPEYFFIVEINGQKFGEAQESGLLEFKDFIEISLKDPEGNPFSDEEYILILADGSERKGKLDQDGYAKIVDVPPGKFTVKFPNL